MLAALSPSLSLSLSSPSIMSTKVITLFCVVLLSNGLASLSATLRPRSFGANRGSKFYISNVTAQVLTETSGAPRSLFGVVRHLRASATELRAGKHPRIIFGRRQWENSVNSYADNRHRAGSWAKFFLDYTLDKGPDNDELNCIVAIDTSAYTGRPGMNKMLLRKLALKMDNMSEYNEGGMFMYTLHAVVNENRRCKQLASERKHNVRSAIQLIVNYAKIVLAHYATYGCSNCTYVRGMRRSDLWDTKRAWFIINDWHTAGLGIALSYDVLYDRLSLRQKMFIRSALAVSVHGREHWGVSNISSSGSPNAEQHPHRIFSNWATYHANLHLVNLAIQGETQFDHMTTNLGARYSTNLDRQSKALTDAFMAHSIYADGSTFEDGYMYNLGMREGSLLFVALARRGINHIHTQRYRNFIYNGAQMMEPFHCGQLVGHSSGGGQLYPTWQALARYLYPWGELPAMLWRQRMGTVFQDFQPCRITFHQTMMQLAILGMDHQRKTRFASSPAAMSKEARRNFALSFYAPRRGLLIARSSHAEDSLYMHFDARPDAFLLGHDNSDRGVFTLTALRRTWIDELSWRYPDSQLHSLMHVDGQAQGLKAPSVAMLKVLDDVQVVLAAADLTYAYNVQWVRAFAGQKEPRRKEKVFEGSKSYYKWVTFSEKEKGGPTQFGWPADDPGTDLGFTNKTSLWGERDIGFSGFYVWKRPYRRKRLSYAVRSVALVRMHGNSSYVVIGDDFASAGRSVHKFDSYLILRPNVHVDSTKSQCYLDQCLVVLSDGTNRHLDVHVSTLGANPSFYFETIASNFTRLIFSSTRRKSEQFCVVLHPHYNNIQGFFLHRNENNCTISFAHELRAFSFDPIDHTLRTYQTAVWKNEMHPVYSRPVPIVSPEPSSDPFDDIEASPQAHEAGFFKTKRTKPKTAEASHVPKTKRTKISGRKTLRQKRTKVINDREAAIGKPRSKHRL